MARKLDLASSGNGLDADGVKLFCGAMGKNVADRAIQVLKLEIYFFYRYICIICEALNKIESRRGKQLVCLLQLP